MAGIRDLRNMSTTKVKNPKPQTWYALLASTNVEVGSTGGGGRSKNTKKKGKKHRSTGESANYRQPALAWPIVDMKKYPGYQTIR